MGKGGRRRPQSDLLHSSQQTSHINDGCRVELGSKNALTSSRGSGKYACVHFSIKLPVNELVFNGAVRDGTRSWVQASGRLPDHISSVVARFQKQGLVKACVQSGMPGETKTRLQTPERRAAMGVSSFQDGWPPPL